MSALKKRKITDYNYQSKYSSFSERYHTKVTDDIQKLSSTVLKLEQVIKKLTTQIKFQNHKLEELSKKVENKEPNEDIQQLSFLLQNQKLYSEEIKLPEISNSNSSQTDEFSYIS